MKKFRQFLEYKDDYLIKPNEGLIVEFMSQYDIGNNLEGLIVDQFKQNLFFLTE